MKIFVYIIPDEGNSSKLSELLTGDGVDGELIQRVTLNQHPSNTSKKSYNYDWINLNHSIKDLINNANDEIESIALLYIKDSSLTSADSAIINEQLREIMNLENEHKNKGELCSDIIYLSKYNDRCDMHMNMTSLNHNNSYLSKVISPHGTQALLIMPEGIKIIQNKEFQSYNTQKKTVNETLNIYSKEGKINSSAVTPNLFVYDIRLGESDEDYRKTHECKNPYKKYKNVNKNKVNYLFFIIIFIIIVFLLWVFIRATIN